MDVGLALPQFDYGGDTDAPFVAIVSERLTRQRFASPADAVGRLLVVNVGNAPSPAASAALNIGRVIVEKPFGTDAASAPYVLGR